MILETNAAANLLPCLARLAQLQHETVDRLALQEAAEAALSSQANNPQNRLKIVAEHLQVRAPRWLDRPDAAVVPVLIYVHNGERQGEWGILRGNNAQSQWISEWWDAQAGRWHEQADDNLPGRIFASLKLSKPYSASASPVYQLIRQEIFAHKQLIWEAIIGGIIINIVAMTTSFYSMQIYDRVVPTGASQTLLVLTLGVLMAILFELVAKRVR
ncbi:MAG: hypothetical protein ACXW1Z_24705, partial [Methylobacter sp.]